MKKQILEPRYKPISKDIIKNHNSEARIRELDFLLKDELNIDKYEKLTDGICSSVYKISHEGEKKIIKISTGIYRTYELEREARGIDYLVSIGYGHIVPNIKKYKISNEYGYIIEDYVEGVTLREKLSKYNSNEYKLEMWKAAGEALGELHRAYNKEDKDSSWLNGQLEMARVNMENNLLDSGEFLEETPEEVLEWLHLNRPNRKQSSILHGDFRTKNIMIDDKNNCKIMI